MLDLMREIILATDLQHHFDILTALTSMAESKFTIFFISNTVKPMLSGHSKIDKPKILMTNGSLMKVESIAECSPWSILQYF